VQSCNAGGTQCIVTSPAGTAGTTADVTVAISGLTSSATPADHFQYVGLDVNGDGLINAVDALCILRTVATEPGTGPCPSPLPNSADLNLDGRTDALDGLCLLRFIAKLSATPGCPVGP
jgi:hypothetical protein